MHYCEGFSDFFFSFISTHFISCYNLRTSVSCINQVPQDLISLMRMLRKGTKWWKQVSRFTRHGDSDCEKQEGWVLLATVSVLNQHRAHCENNSFLDPLPLPPSLFPKASSVAPLHLHVENFVTQYTHIHLSTMTTSITSQTPFCSPKQRAPRCQRFCVMFSTTSLLLKRTKLQFMLNSSYNTPSLKISYSNPLSLARTQQFSWARTQFASALKQALPSSKVQRCWDSFGPCS